MEATQKSTFCLEQIKNSSSFRLKACHDYYYQIQTQLYCTGRQWCDFVVRTDKDLHIERIYRDESWLDTNLQKVKNFYFSAVLPELVCPTYHLHFPFLYFQFLVYSHIIYNYLFYSPFLLIILQKFVVFS